MPANSSLAYGRKGVIDLVRALMTRREQGGMLRNQQFPILVVEGFPGAGKTALLSNLAARLDQQVPHAQLDLEANKQASVPQLLSALAFELSRKCPRYGALQFPRFIIGQLVMNLELDLTDRSRARRQVVEELQRHRGFEAAARVLQDMAGGVLDIMGRHVGVPVKPPDNLLRQAVKWMMEHVLGQRIVLGPFQEWYGHRDLGLPHNSIDVLIELRRRATNSAEEDNRQWIDDLCWAAFLADLRAEFTRGRRADERSLNCVVLLDNADTDLGRRFLHQLVRARSERAVGEPDDADPMTVVTTSRGGLLADLPPAHLAEDTDQAAGGPGHTRTGQPPSAADWSRVWWLRHRLPDLTEDEVGRAVTDMALSWGDNRRLARLVYQLTGGHPASTRLMLDTVARLAPQKWIEPEAILGRRARPDPAHQHPATVEADMLGRMLGDVPAPALRDLEVCAAARERDHALALAGHEDLVVSGPAHYGEDLDPVLWPADGSAGPVLLRRLLRRCLARRDSSVAPNWSKVYAKLRHLCRTGGDEAGELYYALAEGELGFVARRLRGRLEELDSTAWAGLLTSVTAAPHEGRHPQVPIDEVGALVSEAGLDADAVPVGQLVAGLWIAADPFTDSRRRNLHFQIAVDYAAVSRVCPGGPHAVFLEAERRHRREAGWWD